MFRQPLNMKSEASTADSEPLPNASKIFLISITHNYIMRPRRSNMKVFAVVAVLVIVWFSMALVKEVLQVSQIDAAVPRHRPQRLQSKLGKVEILGNQGGREWDTSVLSTSISVRPPCTTNAALLILITSAPRNFNMRAAIRQTWCAKSSRSLSSFSDELDNGSNKQDYLCTFLVGRSGSADVDSQVHEEIDIYDDILFGEYADTYRNLTFKVLTGFLWGSVNCLANFVLKTDDDCFVNVPVFLKFLSLQEKRSHVYAGHVFKSREELQVIRGKDSKWAVPMQAYPPEYYPPYVSGTGYILSSDVLYQIVNYSRHYPPFPNEDAYIGVLAEQLHIVPIHSARFTLISNGWSLCNYQYLLVLHQVDEIKQKELLDTADRAAVHCQHHNFLTRWE